jgi:hypothetical protein
MNRFEDCDENLVHVFMEVLENKFPVYQNLNFKLVFDTKKKTKGGKIVLASIEPASEKIKFFSRDDIAVEGYDYVLIIDKKAWELANDKDKRRIISHEFKHVFVDDKGSCKTVGHEIEDFYSEIEANKDDPEWGRKLCMLVSDVYDQERDLAKQAKNKEVI